MRKSLNDDALSTAVGGICPARLRHALIRLLSLSTPALCRLPIPHRLELMYKLEQESLQMRSSRRIVAVSPGFGDTVVSYYPGVRDK